MFGDRTTEDPVPLISCKHISNKSHKNISGYQRLRMNQTLHKIILEFTLKECAHYRECKNQSLGVFLLLRYFCCLEDCCLFVNDRRTRGCGEGSLANTSVESQMMSFVLLILTTDFAFTSLHWHFLAFFTFLSIN